MCHTFFNLLNESWDFIWIEMSEESLDATQKTYSTHIKGIYRTYTFFSLRRLIQ